jgi:hypothetical protein
MQESESNRPIPGNEPGETPLLNPAIMYLQQYIKRKSKKKKEGE